MYFLLRYIRKMPNCHCGKNALYNIIGEKALFCISHKEPHMINVITKKCEFKGCITRPSFGVKGGKRQFCKTHKTADMVDTIHDICEHMQCNTIAYFNKKGEKIGRFCSEHALPDMVDIKNKCCEAEDCLSRAHYDFLGKKGRFCTEHKQDSMINITNKTCESDGCEKQPTFNIKGETKGRFCSEHKMDHMVDVKNKLCEYDKCTVRAHFDIVGGKGKFCASHKLDNMINVKDKNCISDGCDKQRIYNINGKKPQYCITHKTEHMVNVSYKLCTIVDCTLQAQYGFLSKDTSLCKTHRQKGMLLRPKQKCSSCNQLGTYELNSERFCQTHTPATADNLGIATCTSCGLDDILLKGLCETCDPTIIQIRVKAKELRVKNLLEAEGIPFVHDKMLEGPVCGRERPDFQIDCGSHFVYIEVDEHQHQSYACECEQTRMINLAQVRSIPVVFIRYNPDIYDPVKGQKMIRLEQREKKLVEWVHYTIAHQPQEMNALVTALYLFYDEHDTAKPDWHILIAR